MKHQAGDGLTVVQLLEIYLSLFRLDPLIAKNSYSSWSVEQYRKFKAALEAGEEIKSTNTIHPVSTIPAEKLISMRDYGIIPSTTIIAISDNQIAHMVRDVKKRPLSEADILSLSILLSNKDNKWKILTKYDKITPNVMVAWETDNRWTKIIIHLNYRIKGKVLNMIKTAERDMSYNDISSLEGFFI